MYLKIKTILLITFFLSLHGCKNDDNETNNIEFDNNIITGEWRLDATKGFTIDGFVEMKPDSKEIHSYYFENDGTFTRSSFNQTIPEVKGIYEISKTHPQYPDNSKIEYFIDLTYGEKIIFFNCGLIDDNKQVLFIRDNDDKLQNTLPSACDGLSLIYKKEN